MITKKKVLRKIILAIIGFCFGCILVMIKLLTGMGRTFARAIPFEDLWLHKSEMIAIGILLAIIFADSFSSAD